MANQCTASEASLQPCQESTLCDECRETAETFVMEESSVAAELLVCPNCAKTAARVPDSGGQTYPCRTKA